MSLKLVHYLNSYSHINILTYKLKATSIPILCMFKIYHFFVFHKPYDKGITLFLYDIKKTEIYIC